jgi:uncharacterized RDD family membrane protein YckC
MKSTRWRIAAFLAAITVAVVAISFSAGLTAVGGTTRLTLPVSIALGGPVVVRETANVRRVFPGIAQVSYARELRFGRAIVRVGQDYTLPADEVAREVRSVFGDVTVKGRVERDVVVVFGNVHLASTAVVDGSLAVLGGSATIDPGAVVDRDLIVAGGTLTAPADFSPGGTHFVVGSIRLGNALKGIVPWITRGLLWGRLIVPELGWVWLVAGIAFLVYLVVSLLFDRPVRACADAIVARPISALLLGLLVLVLTIPVLVILAATVIGLAIVPFVLCAMLVGGLFGKVGVARAIGRAVVPESSADSKLQSTRSFVLGSAVMMLAYAVPLVGIMTWALTGVLAVGAAAMMFRGALRREHPAREPVPVAPPPVQAHEASVAGPVQAPLPQPPAADAAGDVSPGSAEVSVPAPPPIPSRVAGDMSLFPRAGFFDRVAAFAIDCLLVGIAVLVLDAGGRDGWFWLLLIAYHIAFWAWKGTTLGGVVVGLRVVRTQGDDPRFPDSLIRGLAAILSVAALGIGCFWMLQDTERQMWHDKIAGTLVVKVPREMVLR